MPEHGDYNSASQKWYCNYWMTLQQWKDIHDYTPQNVTIQQIEKHSYDTKAQVVEDYN